MISFGNLGKKKTGAAAKAPVVKKVKAPPLDFKKISEDFKNLDPKEPGTWPLLPRLFAFVAVVALIVLLGWWFIWQPQMDEMEAKTNEEKQLRDQWKDKKRQTVNLDAYRQQLAEIDHSFGELLKQLPNKSEMESLLTDINQAGVGRGLKFVLFKPNPEALKEFYAELPITVELIGSYNDIGGFAGDIARLPRVVTLNDIQLSNNQGAEGGKIALGELKLAVTVKTFRYLDEEEIAQQRKLAAEKKKK